MHFHTGRLMTAQAAKAAILRTIKLNGGAAYIWGAVKTIDAPSQYTLVFHLKYASPLDLEASADYSAYIYDTQAAGGGGNLTKWLNTPHDAGTGPYTLQTWNNGQEFEVILKSYSGYWGGWSGAHYKRGLPGRPAGHHRSAAAAVRPGQLHRADEPHAVEVAEGHSGIKLVSAPSWQNLLGQLNTRALSQPVRQAISYGIDYKGMIAALSGAASPPAASSRRPARPLHRPAQLQLRPGQGQGPAERGGIRAGQEGDEPVPHLHPGRQQRASSPP